MDKSAIQRLHEAACDRGEPAYSDPETGLFVLTERFLRQRGYCCRRGCRHCPWRNQVEGLRPARPARERTLRQAH